MSALFTLDLDLLTIRVKHNPTIGLMRMPKILPIRFPVPATTQQSRPPTQKWTVGNWLTTMPAI